MGSTETKMTVARTSVVVATVAAAGCIAAMSRLPIFRLRLANSDRWIITQSLWTTDIYTPFAEKHVPVLDFTKNCKELSNAFRVAQAANVITLVALALTFLCGLLHLAPSFTSTNKRVRKVCGLPICLLLLTALVAIGVQGYVVKCMYEKDTWCSQNTDNNTVGDIGAVGDGYSVPVSAIAFFRRPPIMDEDTPDGGPIVVAQPLPLEEGEAILAEDREEKQEPEALVQENPLPYVIVPAAVRPHTAIMKNRAFEDAYNRAFVEAMMMQEDTLRRTQRAIAVVADTPNVVLLADVLANDEGEGKNKCDPFAGCIASYEDMGFRRDRGYTVVWAALYVAVFALVVEMIVMAVGASVVPQAGVTQETVALLHGDEEGRII